MTEDLAWGVYNFINEWKAGNHGEICLQEALDRDFSETDFEEPVSEVWHDSNYEQPKDQRTVVILNPEEKSGEVLQRCLCVYENRIWAYLEDLLPT